MNKIFKILILVVYTFAIFAVAFLIVSLTDKGVNFKDYGDKYSDENIAVVTQVVEKRENKKQTKTDYEQSKYSIYFFVKKIKSIDIKDVYVYIAVETEEGIKYVQTTSGKTLTGSSTVLSTMVVNNDSSNKFAVNEVIEENEVVKHVNRIPDNIYVKVIYKTVVDVLDDKGKKETVETPCELNYKVKYDDVEKENFDDFEKREIVTTSNGNTQYIDYKKDYVSVKFLKIAKAKTETQEAYNDYRVSTLKIIKSNLPSNVGISKFKMEITAEITNEELLNNEYFSKYVKLFVYEGALVVDIANSRTVSLAEDYKVEKIYFDIEFELENGETSKVKYYVLTADLLEG